MKATVKGLVEEANAKVKTHEVQEAIKLVKNANVQFVDVREDREVQEEGMIPGAIHASRGMLEYYLDPESPYFKKEFAAGKDLVFYCKSGGRSALATQRAVELGYKNVSHVGGGLNAWKAAGGPLQNANNREAVPAD
ncbi:MAG TPA: rhodanese-like domain-containing protein [Cyclobacteriaceae bacterium]|jgi:rhodanese-related sulfurtransferase